MCTVWSRAVRGHKWEDRVCALRSRQVLQRLGGLGCSHMRQLRRRHVPGNREQHKRVCLHAMCRRTHLLHTTRAIISSNVRRMRHRKALHSFGRLERGHVRGLQGRKVSLHVYVCLGPVLASHATSLPAAAAAAWRGRGRVHIAGWSYGGVGPVRGLRGGGRRGWCEEWARRG
jgi:hypothetical protein